MLIELKKINKTYDMEIVKVNALKNIDLKIKKGEFLSIMGPSGSGKSTLMNLIGCLDTPTSGEYYFEGEIVSRMNDNQLAEIRNKKIGFIFQSFNLLPRLSVFHNVELPLIYAGIPSKKRKKLVEEIVEKVNLSERIYHKPNELSGGQKQRVAIARALINNPSLILADEPTGNLDSKTGKEIMELLQSINKQGNTLILVTHDVNIAKYSERIIYLLDGEIEKEEYLSRN